jgi:hypothetical protein
MQSHSQSQQWLSIVEYARAFGISDMTIRRRIRTGRIPAELRDGKYYIMVQLDKRTGQPIKPNSNSSMQQQQPTNTPMKNHPRPDSTFLDQDMNLHVPTMSHEYRPNPTPSHARPLHNQNIPQQGNYNSAPNQNWSEIPGHLVMPNQISQEMRVEATALLDYCNATLSNARNLERQIEQRYQAQLRNNDLMVRQKDQEIAKLNQQIEDLQLLVQILEKKR